MLTEAKLIVGGVLLAILAAGAGVLGHKIFTAGEQKCVKNDTAVEAKQQATVNTLNAANQAKHEAANESENAELKAIADLQFQPIAAPIVRMYVGPAPANRCAVPGNHPAPAPEPAAAAALHDDPGPARGQDIEPKIRALMIEADTLLAECRALDRSAP